MPRTSPKLSPEAASAKEGGLVYVADADPGLSRRATATGFRYVDPSGKPVRDAATLERIRALAIPPAYREVWICKIANGHLQATGRDARGRKEAFGAALPRLRRQLRRDLALPGFPERKVAAMLVAVMADTLVRIGNAG